MAAKHEVKRLIKKYGELVTSMIMDQDKHDHMVVEMYNALLWADEQIESLEAWGNGMRKRAQALEDRLND